MNRQDAQSLTTKTGDSHLQYAAIALWSSYAQDVQVEEEESAPPPSTYSHLARGL